MKDTWWNHNTDKVMLFVLVLILALMTMHVVHHDPGDMEAVAWVTGSFSTVLGALILILTGRKERADGQTANGLPPTPPSPPAVAPQEQPKP